MKIYALYKVFTAHECVHTAKNVDMCVHRYMDKKVHAQYIVQSVCLLRNLKTIRMTADPEYYEIF